MSAGNFRLDLWKRMHLDAPLWQYPLWIGQQMKAAVGCVHSGVIAFGETGNGSSYNPPHIVNHRQFDFWLAENATRYQSERIAA
jgi:hypothetical protein